MQSRGTAPHHPSDEAAAPPLDRGSASIAGGCRMLEGTFLGGCMFSGRKRRPRRGRWVTGG